MSSTTQVSGQVAADKLIRLELDDGYYCDGISYGADKSVSGELVFQTGMVGYPESLTDPSYRGQILVCTFPLAGNYGVPSKKTVDKILQDLPAHFESSEIHIAGLVTASYSGENFSHYLAESSLGTWLRENNVPAMHAVDTRLLTKKIRRGGTNLARMLIGQPMSNGISSQVNGHLESDGSGNGNGNGNKQLDAQPSIDFAQIPWQDQNKRNLVADVSIREPKVYSPPRSVALHHSSGRPIRVVCVDVGLKYNQLRCFLKRGVEVEVVPWNYDFPALSKFDGLFISNGPGDPAMLDPTMQNIRKVLEDRRTPVFGICLGHQLLARAAGCTTSKMKFGNRGHNIPCTHVQSGRCYITSQNHGFQVDASSLPEGWEELFINANDGSNEGIRHVSLPYFSVQFHPESNPGPRDTEFLFDVFISTVQKAIETQEAMAQPVTFPGGLKEDNHRAHPRVHVKKVLVLGSGGLSIGQAGEFDYSGSQAIKALKQEGIYTILVNPNIATIQTSKGLADKVYFLPVTADSVRKIIKREKPDAVYVTFGGQTALGVGIALKDEFEKLGVRVLGTPIETIVVTEDREKFARSMESIGEKCAKSRSAVTIQEAVTAGHEIGYPVIIRAAYALGGLGSGFANNEAELLELCNKAFAASPQVLVERSMKGWKEIEYEVVRDAQDNCITVCNMENFDPLGIHTGDSIVVAPSQTLSDEDYNMLRTTAVNVIRHLGVVGECNIQYALNPDSKEYCIIEVNARLSRSSALASKATGYPLAFVAAKLGLGIPLNEIKNSVTQKTCACFEPSLDYVVVKIPRWDLKKFTRVSNLLSSSMKSVGEVMSIGRTFEEAIQKGIRAVDYSNTGFNETETALMSIDSELQTPSDQRLFAIANAMARGYSVEKIWELTKIDRWFLRKLEYLIQFGKKLSTYHTSDITVGLLKKAKQLGFSDQQIAKFLTTSEMDIRRRRVDAGITPVVKQIDTVAAEFPAVTNYLYLTYNGSEHDVTFDDHGVMVLGSGVYRIGSSVEFDWCSVRAIRTLRENGFKTVMLNYNPETVSTDYDEADRLYFENITIETVLDIYGLEDSSGVIVSVGGQTPNNIALNLHSQNVKVLGTTPEMIQRAENRFKFSRTLDSILIDQPEWKNLISISDAEEFCKGKYPVLVRPSFVLSGAAMNTVYSEKDLKNFLDEAVAVSKEHPVVITKYIEGAKEIEMDAVARDGKVICHFVSEHVENAGVHSGDATLILPPQDLEEETVRRIEDATRKIANAFNITGPLNIQFIAKDNEIKVIECNIRASRSFPFVSKVMGIDLIEMATKVMIGIPVQEYPPINIPANYVGVKVPQFSFSRLSGADPVTGVEMASTGEVACFGRDKYEAYIKASISTGFRLPKKNVLFSVGSYEHKVEILPSIQKLHSIGYKIFATPGTADFIEQHGIPVTYLETLGEEQEQASEYSLTQHLANNLIDLYINLPSNNRFRRPANYMSKGYRTRRMAVDYQTPLVTNVKNAKILVEAIARNFDFEISDHDYQTSHRTVTLPGLINVAAFVPGLMDINSDDFEKVTRASIMAGFSMIRVMPMGLDRSLVDATGLRVAQQNSRRAGGAKCDFNFSVTATTSNAEQVAQMADQIGSLFIPFNQLTGNISKVSAITAHFTSWPSYKPIVTDAKTADLASMLYIASLHSRKIHVTDVSTEDDIGLIALSKERGFPVTCDISIYSLFFNQLDCPACPDLPTEKDQAALWSSLDVVDILSVGTLPYKMAKALDRPLSSDIGLKDSLPLLFSAVADGRLTVDDVIAKLHDNPKRIFDIHDQEGCSIEVEVDRAQNTSVLNGDAKSAALSFGAIVQRVTFKNSTSSLDDEFQATSLTGRDMSTHLPPELQDLQAKRHNVVKIPGSPVQEPAPLRKQSLAETTLTKSARRTSFGQSAEANASSRVRRTSFMQSPELRPRVGPPSAYDRPNTLRLTERARPTSSPIGSQEQSQTYSALREDQEMAIPPPLPFLSNSSLDYMSHSPFKGRSILSVNDWSKEDLHLLFSVSTDMRIAVQRQGVLPLLSSKVICSAFFEPSTRTSMSFDAAMERLGGHVTSMPMVNSTAKGESLSDTIQTMACYGDAIVLRHPDNDSAHIAARACNIPIINAGNGTREHPTQAFLDLFTIREELGTANGLTVTFVGDLKYGRTVHSLCQLLAHYPTTTIQLISPPTLTLPDKIRKQLLARGQLVAESTTLSPSTNPKDAKLLAQSDVIYATRVQKERFDTEKDYESVKDSFRLDAEMLRYCKKTAVVMHPLPRNRELAEEVDFDARAAYFRQMRYGLFVRMALLALVLAP